MFFPSKKKIPSKKITKSQYVLVVPNLQSLIPPLTSALNSGTRFSLHFSSSPLSTLQLFRFLLRFFLSIRVSVFFFFSLFRFPEQPSYARVATIPCFFFLSRYCTFILTCSVLFPLGLLLLSHSVPTTQMPIFDTNGVVSFMGKFLP